MFSSIIFLKQVANPEQLQVGINEFHFRNPQDELPERIFDIAIYVIGSEQMDNKSNVERADVLSFFKDAYLLTKVTSQFYNPDDDIEENEV